jgi:hypothetical protein
LGTAAKGKVIFEALVDMATKGLREIHQNGDLEDKRRREI